MRVPHTYKELIRIITTLRYENLLLFKSQNNVASNIAITEKKKSSSDIWYIRGVLWDEVIDLTDEPVFQCNVPAANNTSLGDDNNDRKKALIGILNILFLKLIMCIVLVS